MAALCTPPIVNLRWLYSAEGHVVCQALGQIYLANRFTSTASCKTRASCRAQDSRSSSHRNVASQHCANLAVYRTTAAWGKLEGGWDRPYFTAKFRDEFLIRGG